MSSPTTGRPSLTSLDQIDADVADILGLAPGTLARTSVGARRSKSSNDSGRPPLRLALGLAAGLATLGLVREQARPTDQPGVASHSPARARPVKPRGEPVPLARAAIQPSAAMAPPLAFEPPSAKGSLSISPQTAPLVSKAPHRYRVLRRKGPIALAYSHRSSHPGHAEVMPVEAEEGARFAESRLDKAAVERRDREQRLEALDALRLLRQR